MQDILDLCRLNLMEETVEKSPAIDRDTTLAAIDVARRGIVTKMEPSPISEGVMDRHYDENTAEDGTYPWTESPLSLSREDNSPRRATEGGESNE